MNQKEIAVSRFAEGFNCAQSVFSVLAPQLGLPEETALKVAAAFGGGMGRTGEVCGVVSGALMAIGLKYGAIVGPDEATKAKTYALAREFMDHFRARHGNVRCSDLLGCDAGTHEGRQWAKEKGLFETLCPALVGDAVEIASDILERA